MGYIACSLNRLLVNTKHVNATEMRNKQNFHEPVPWELRGYDLAWVLIYIKPCVREFVTEYLLQTSTEPLSAAVIRSIRGRRDYRVEVKE